MLPRTHLFDADVDVAVQDAAMSQAVGFHSSHLAGSWWPACMWMQFGSTTINGTDLIPCVPDARMHGLLRVPLSLATVADVIKRLVIPPHNGSTTKTDTDTDTHGAMARWMNANQWTVAESEFYMVRMYHLMQRNLPVDDSPRFQRAESEPLIRLIQTNRQNATAVYAFAMLLRHGEFPVTMNAIESWLSDERTVAWGCVRQDAHIPTTDGLYAIHRFGIVRQVFLDTQRRCLHGGVIRLAMQRLLAALYITANRTDGDWMRSRLFNGKPSSTQYIHR